MKMEQEEANGYHNALRLAHTHLEYRLKSSEQRRDLTERENEIHKQTIVSEFFFYGLIKILTK